MRAQHITRGKPGISRLYGCISKNTRLLAAVDGTNIGIMVNCVNWEWTMCTLQYSDR